jgi:hypothetical protein
LGDSEVPPKGLVRDAGTGNKEEAVNGESLLGASDELSSDRGILAVEQAEVDGLQVSPRDCMSA